MRITAVVSELIQVPFNGGPMAVVQGAEGSAMATLLVGLETEDGRIGWGEAFGHGSCAASQAALHSLVAPAVLGRDAGDRVSQMHDIESRMHLFGRSGPVRYAVAGIDLALWDLAGKAAGQPLHRLLGAGKRDTLPAYASLLRYGEAQALADACRAAVAEGYKQIKLHEIEPPLIRAARAAIGPAVALMVDTNCPWPVDVACQRADTLHSCNLAWLEEPVWPPEDHAGLARVRAHGTPIAAGENYASAMEFHQAMVAGAIDIAQPSVAKIGLTDALKVVALAQAHAVKLVPHCAYFGPGYLASLHLVAALGGDTPFERLWVDLEASPFGELTKATRGRVAVPQAPGLGCDPDPAVIAKYRTAAPGRSA